MRRLGVFFAAIPDPRAGNARHDLSELLFIACAATLCGAETCEDMAEFGCAKEALLREILRLEHGIPSHDTFSRVFRLLDAQAFEAAFQRFTEAFGAHLSGQIGTAGQVVAIDGKSLRGAFEAGARTTPLHLVTAWATEQRLVLAQRRAPERNEITAALELLALLDLEATTVTGDALHGNREMAKTIRQRGGDYVLAIKGNRGPLYHETVRLLADIPAAASDAPVQPQHSRMERRDAAVLPVPADWPERFGFADLAAVARIDSIRHTTDSEQRQSRYFALSRTLAAAVVLSIVRAHWGIENCQHWVLDVVFREDAARSRKDNAAQNLALLRRLALNVLRANTHKASIRRKIKRAGWEDAYLLSLLSQMR
jgi:predicted transposase YbfD/YdcC